MMALQQHMKFMPVLALMLLVELLSLLVPDADAAYYYYSYRSYRSYRSYYYSYRSYRSYRYTYYTSYSYSYIATCSTGCIIGASIGGMLLLGGLIGLVVFVFCFCKHANKRTVQPSRIATVSARVETSATNPNQLPKPPPYSQEQLYPPVGQPYPPAYPPPAAAQPGDAAPETDGTAYPPPGYSEAAAADGGFQQQHQLPTPSI